MKRFTFLSLLTLAIQLTLTAQNQNVIIDDVYFSPSGQIAAPGKNTDNHPRPNYKNGAKEIVYKEKTMKYPQVIKDTVFVDGKAPDGYAVHDYAFDIKRWDGHTDPVYVHDTIYSEPSAMVDSISNNREQGYYLNGFNGSESDKEYAERIRLFHNPRYSIFIGDPRYNDIYFLNNYDWNVYVDGSYAYVTPTWTNPLWWNYNFSPMGGYGYGGWGHGWYSPYYGYGGMYSPWWGYDSFYGYGGMYGYGNYWDPYGYGYCGYGYGGYYGYGHGNWGSGWVTSRNKNYDELTRRSTGNYGSGATTRLGGSRTESAASTVNSGGLMTSSRTPYTVVNGSNPTNSYVTRVSSGSTTSRLTGSQSGGIGIVRNSFNRGYSATTGSSGSTVRTSSGAGSTSSASSSTVSTRPRTYTATSGSVPTGTYPSRDNGTSVTTFRNTTPTVTRSTGTVAPSHGSSNYNGSSRSSGSSNYTPSSSSSSYSGGSSYSPPSSSSGSSGSGSSSSSGGGGRSSGGGGRR